MNTIYLILTLIIVLLSYNLVYGKKQRETFEVNKPVNKSVDETIINDTSVNKLSDLDKKTPIFKDFCDKLNFINNNHNESANTGYKI